MKYLIIVLLAITTTTHAVDRENYYFTPIKVSTQKQYDYILDNLIISAAMANELKNNAKLSSQILNDYDSVLTYKSEACRAYEINKTLENFFKTNNEFHKNIDEVRVDYFVKDAKLKEIEIAGCDAVQKTHFNNMIEKAITNK